MSDIIVLSDSDDSASSENKCGKNNQSIEKDCSDYEDDFQFPKVHFHQAISEDEEDPESIAKKKFSSDLESCKYRLDKTKRTRAVLNECDNNFPTTSQISKRYNNRKFTSSESAEDLNNDNRIREKQKKAKTGTKKNKTQVTENRQKRQEQLNRDKALKAIAQKKANNLKPGECIKFMEIILDKDIENFISFGDIITTLLDANIQYSIDTNLIPNSVAWKRTIEDSYVNERNEICTKTNVENVNQLLIIWNWDEAVRKVDDETFCASIYSIKATLPDYNVILVILGIEDYFMYKKQEKNSAKNGTKNKKNTVRSSEFKNSPEISRWKLETCLNEIQIVNKISSRPVNNSQELSLIIYQCTKAIAEIPYKLEKNTNITNKFDWYVMGDNRDTVRVDKDGNGLKRLWQQQLCQFTLSSLEIADAICSMYPSPTDLLEAYMNCTHDEGMNLLKDIPIRRTAGPITSARKVGPELSKKIYIMFTSKDGESILK